MGKWEKKCYNITLRNKEYSADLFSMPAEARRLP
jgi:hypothetical protein